VKKSDSASDARKASIFNQAVASLKALVAAQSLDSARQAVSMALAESIRTSFLRDEALRPVSDPCLHRLAGTPCPRDPTVASGSRKVDCRPAWADHDEMFSHDGQHVFVAQPYRMNLGEVRDLVRICDELGLDADVSAFPSWHFPGRTLAVVLRKAEK
jgi:hypothetical protein